jgi:hypothetical protein
MRTTLNIARSATGNKARAKIIEYPRKKLTMPEPIKSRASFPGPDPRSEAIRAYVRGLLKTPHFTSNSRRGQLFSYLVEHTLAGDAAKINEYAIGLDVFERPTSFDPRIESLVRTELSRLRRRLKEYYAGDGNSDPIAIELPPRSYAASFAFRDEIEAAKPLMMLRLVPPAPKTAATHLRRALIAIAIALRACSRGLVRLCASGVAPDPSPVSANTETQEC